MYRHKSTIKTKLHYFAVCHNHMLHRLHHHLPMLLMGSSSLRDLHHTYVYSAHKHTRAHTQSPIDIKYKNITFNKAPLFATENHFVCVRCVHSYTQVFLYIYARLLCAACTAKHRKKDYLSYTRLNPLAAGSGLSSASHSSQIAVGSHSERTDCTFIFVSFDTHFFRFNILTQLYFLLTNTRTRSCLFCVQ